MKIIKYTLLILCFFVTGCKGDSAYDLAVENGFNGTVEDYLESLKGENSNITIFDIFNSLVELGEYESDEYAVFINDYISSNLTDDTSSSITMNNSLASAVGIKVSFGTITKTYYAGSGVVYQLTEKGVAYIITNHHVVSNPNDKNSISDNIKIYLYGIETDDYAYTASYIGSHEECDISILRVQLDTSNKAKYVESVEIYDDRIYAGDYVYTVGNPLGYGLSITQGIISVDSEEISTSYDVRVMRIDVAVNAGNSGGPLFNKDGLLIGIVDAKIVDVEIEGICYAIPIATVSNIANNILKNSSNAKIVNIGFEYNTYSSSMYFDTSSLKYYIKEIVCVTEIDISSDAYQAGLRSGDQITSVVYNERKYSIERYFTLDDILYGCFVDDEIIVNTYRTSTQSTIQYTFILKY